VASVARELKSLPDMQFETKIFWVWALQGIRVGDQDTLRSLEQTAHASSREIGSSSGIKTTG